MYRVLPMIALMATVSWGQTPTIPIGEEHPRDRLELPLLVNRTPVPDTAAVGIDFAPPIVCTPVVETVQGRAKSRLRCTVAP